MEAKRIYAHLRKLIGIRKENEALSFGYLFTLYADYFFYAYMREYRGNTIIVCMNSGLEPMSVPVTIDIGSNTNIPSRIKQNLAKRRVLDNLLNPNEQLFYSEQGNLMVQLPGKSAHIYKLQ